MRVQVVYLVIQEVHMIRRRTHRIFFLMFSVFLTGMYFHANSQESVKILEGTVSYITGKSIYVRFENTSGIENGDTLFILKDELKIPALVVQHQSSISCLCNPVDDRVFTISEKIMALIRVKGVEEVVGIPQENRVEHDINEQVLKSEKPLAGTKPKGGNFSGSLSVSSYSIMSNAGSDDSHRLRYIFSNQAKNIGGSKLSAESYISFSHKLNHWDEVSDNLNNALKIYGLSLQYDVSNSISVWAGRKINPNVANVGAIDGVQVQKQWKNLFAGVAAGMRPDYLDYGFNPDLFEYGAYLGFNKQVEHGFVQTSLAFFEQRNQAKTDRRFVYFQHNNSFLKNVNFYSSFEFDLYRLENGLPVNAASLTSLYLSVRYRVSRRFSLFGSYDNRRNVIYFETFKNYADAVLDQASRQGLRFRINYNLPKNVFMGVNAGTRFMKNDPRKTNTLNAYITHSNIPGLNASLGLQSNLMQTAYLDGQVHGARLSKDFLSGKFNGMLYYRWVDFKYTSGSTLRQNIGEVDFSWQFNKRFYLSVSYEATIQKNENFSRLYINTRWKF